MKKQKMWKELTDEGRLIEPAEMGPYYATDNLNDNAPFDTEAEALAAFDYMEKEHMGSLGGTYVLIDVYTRG